MADTTSPTVVDAAARLPELRSRIEALRAEIHATRALAANASEAAGILAAWVKAQAAEGLRVLGHSVASIPQRGCLNADHFYPRDEISLAPILFALIGPEVVLDRLSSLVDEVVPSDAPDAKGRRAAVEAMKAELAKAEWEEERVLRVLESAGVPVLRRADARPDIVLALSLEGKAP